MAAPVSAHHVAPIPAQESEYWRSVHGTAWLTCVETYLNQNVDLLTIHNQCLSLSTMNLQFPVPQPTNPFGGYNPYDNPFKDHVIQAPNITF